MISSFVFFSLCFHSFSIKEGYFDVTYDENNPPDFKFPIESYVRPGKRRLFLDDNEIDKLLKNKDISLHKVEKTNLNTNVKNSLNNKKENYIIQGFLLH